MAADLDALFETLALDDCTLPLSPAFSSPATTVLLTPSTCPSSLRAAASSRSPLSALQSTNSARRAVAQMAAATPGGAEPGAGSPQCSPWSKDRTETTNAPERPTCVSLIRVLDALTPTGLRASDADARDCADAVSEADSADEIEEWDSEVDSPERLESRAAPAPSVRLSDQIRWMRAQEAAQGGAAAALGPGVGGILLEGRHGLSAPELAQCVVQLAADQPSAAPRSGAPRGTLLVVAPARLPYWVDACARFAPRARVLVHHGPGRARSTGALASLDLVLTTYHLLSAAECSARARDVVDAHEARGGSVWRQRADRAQGGGGGGGEAAVSLLHMRVWARVVFDESDRHLAQPASKRSRAARAVLAPCRWALAGLAARGSRELHAAVRSSIGLEDADDA